jgi:prepilin-type N-terminal cleavage/methylation domain-containing protein
MSRGFTLVELVVVILVLEILAGVAAPKMLDTTEAANESSAKKSLSVVRDAIALFSVRNGRPPGSDGNQTTFKNDLASYLRKFPVLPVGPAAAQDDVVLMEAGAGPAAGDNSPTEGWKYYYETGDFIMNVHKKTKSDNTVYYDEL